MISNEVNKITKQQNITFDQFEFLMNQSEEDCQYLFNASRQVADIHYGKDIFSRGLIEFTNYCKNDCYYCGIRKSNSNTQRYHLSNEDIISCCNTGYSLGFRTFVLQGGEDLSYSDDQICQIVYQIKNKFPNCAITLSIGEKSKESYQQYYDAGADRYLLRHETADNEHYRMLHPPSMSLDERKDCLYNLKEIGYQVGCGFMVGSPGQSLKTLFEDLQFIKELSPHMVGIGPFIPARGTPFENEQPGTVLDTLKLLAIIRLIHPKVLLPATTALGTINPTGREKGILAGANVVMPNLSPTCVRDKYSLYDNKICTGEEAAECKNCLSARIKNIGYNLVSDRGDSLVK